MELSAITEIAVQYGIFAGLFIVLLIYVIKNNDKRELGYQEMINNLNCKILDQSKQNGSDITVVSQTIDSITDKLSKIDHKVDNVDRKVESIAQKVDSISVRIDHQDGGKHGT